MRIIAFLLFALVLTACDGFDSTDRRTRPQDLSQANITCDSIDGLFANSTELCEKVERLNPNRCATLDGEMACLGSGPCFSCQSADYTPPPPTPAPPPVPPPAPTPPPAPPTNGKISCDALTGRFSDAQQICKYSDAIQNTTCIQLDDSQICTGFGPCISCRTDGYTPPPSPTPTPPPPNPTPVPTPTPTPTPPDPYPWPTPDPGSPGPGEPPMEKPKPIDDPVGDTPPDRNKRPDNSLVMTVSQGRKDGIFVSTNREYEQSWELSISIDPNLCFAKKHPLPFPAGVVKIAEGTSFFQNFSNYLDTKAPDGTPVCYMLTGRGIVEASGWGYREPEQPIPKDREPTDPNPEYKLSATTDRNDGIALKMDPPFLEDFSELYVSPDVPPEADLCPKKGDDFSTPPQELRYVKVMDRYFNGRFYFDPRASWAIDLCYFVVSKRTNRVIDRAVGFRPIEHFRMKSAATTASDRGICYDNPSLRVSSPTGALDFAKPQPILFINDEGSAETDPTPPLEWDWRNQWNQNWLTPVKSQNGCGNCVMQAVASVFEAQLKIHSGWPWWTPELSIDEGFHCGGGECRTGWSTEAALERAKNMGFVDRACGAHINSPNDCQKNECSSHELRRWKLTDYQIINNGTLDVAAIRRALLKGPVLSGMTLPDDFPCYRWGVYRKGPNVDYQNVGHVFAIVGYSDRKKAWIVKNSWGDTWAHNGYGYLYAHDATGFGAHAWSVQLDAASDFVEMEGIQDQDILKRTVSVQLRTARSEGGELTLHITRPQSDEIVFSKSCGVSACQIEIDTTQIPDGSYQIYAQKLSHNTPTPSSSRGMVKAIQILNGDKKWTRLSNVRRDPSWQFQNPSSSQIQKSTPTKALLNQISIPIPVPFPVRPTELKVVFRSKSGRELSTQSTRSIPKNLMMQISPALLPKATHFLEVYLILGDEPPFLYTTIRAPFH